MQLQSEREEFIGRLYAANFDLLEKMCLRMADYDPACADLAADAIQEAFLSADRHYRKLLRHPNPSGWLVLTCKNRMRDALRRERGRRRFAAWSLDGDDSLPLADAGSALDAWIDQEASQQQVEELLKKLTPAERDIAQSYFVEERTMKEAARAGSTTVSSVKSAISRIRGKARELRKK